MILNNFSSKKKKNYFYSIIEFYYLIIFSFKKINQKAEISLIFIEMT